MRNKIIISLVLAGCGSSALNAGPMGSISPMESASRFRPFVSGEGSYTWPQIDGLNFNIVSLATITSVTVNQGWGGRVAAGGLYAMSDRYAFSAEMGWGYYGNAKLEPHFIANSGDQVVPNSETLGLGMDTYGIDILAGIYYTQPKFDLFFKAGALFENIQMNASIIPSALLKNNPRANEFIVNGIPSVMAMSRSVPEVLPEIKLGGAYHLTNNWAVTASWMHAFGGQFGLQAPVISLNPTPIIGNVTVEAHNPTLNTVLFGLEYRFG